MKSSSSPSLAALRRRRAAPASEPSAPRVVRRARSDVTVMQSPVSLPRGEMILTDLIRASRAERREARQKEYLHVSDLLSRCVRKLCLEERYDLPLPPQQLTYMDSVTFAQGDAIADVVMRRLAYSAPDKLWGKWKCKCGYLHIDTPCVFGEVELGDICEHCNTPADTYVEVSQRSEEYKIVGNPDVLLYYKELDAFHVGELKSIAHKQFEELARPKPEHVAQALFYWFLLHRKGIRVTDSISIFYTTKGYVFRGDPYREFVVNAPENLHRLDDFLSDALSVKTFREGGDLPPRIKCASSLSPDAKKCPVNSLCFQDT